VAMLVAVLVEIDLTTLRIIEKMNYGFLQVIRRHRVVSLLLCSF
jgi:hypothetical protein